MPEGDRSEIGGGFQGQNGLHREMVYGELET
jgi:hypothetical protein